MHGVTKPASDENWSHQGREVTLGGKRSCSFWTCLCILGGCRLGACPAFPPSPAGLPATARALEFGGLAGSNPPRRSRELTFPSRACGAAADLHPCHHGAGAIVTWLGLGEASSHGEPSSTSLQASRCTGHKPGTGTVGRSARAQAHPRMAALLLKTSWASGFLHHLHGGEEMREKHRLG